jgi:TolA-binding protein
VRRDPAHPAQRPGPAPVLYRSRRRVLRRMVIPGGLAAIVVGAAIGVAASYLTSQGEAGAGPRPATQTAPPGGASPAPRAATTGPGPASTASTGTSAGGTTSASVPSAGAADGQLLNDEGYARIQAGDYAAAIPPLRRAVAALRGAGPADPYEAYANYNLGYALLQIGDCTGAVPPLEVANRLETSPLVDAAIRRASACANQGS